MSRAESLLVQIDDVPFCAAWRFLLGLAIPPSFNAVAGSNDRVLAYAALFLVLLAALRVGPALLRFALPFSAEAKAVWKKRRFIAKDYDSYQWQKLLWLGLGMLPHAAIGSGLGWGGAALAGFCLVGGGAGLLLWCKAPDGLNRRTS